MEKQRWEESEKRKEKERGERIRRKKMQGRQKVEKLRYAVFCQCFVVLEKSRLAKAASAGPSGEIRYQKLHAVAAPSRFPNIK